MSGLLSRIVSDKLDHVAEAKQQGPLADLEAQIRHLPRPRGFRAALTAAVDAGRPALIAEIKKASPSAGLIRPDFDPAGLARDYAEGGAACLSVLTDRPYFQGDDAYVGRAKAACPLPALRKDFLIDPYQVAEARAIGADAVLIILAILDDGLAGELISAAEHWGLDALVEVHDRAERDRALALQARLIGINNRNLDTLTVDLATSVALAADTPGTVELVAESGLKTPADLAQCRAAGIHRFLVGEHLMRQTDLAAATRSLLSEPAP